MIAITLPHAQHLRLALAPGTPSPQLSTLLALQRAQEHETLLKTIEVSHKELISGLGDRRYDFGLSLQQIRGSWINSEPVWSENIAVALSSQSPLLGRTTLTIADLLEYPLFRWTAEICAPLDRQLSAASQSQGQRSTKRATSFQMLALRVAAGDGIGLSTESRIKRAHAWGIMMRPLAGGPYEITTYLLKPSNMPTIGALARFERRVQATFQMRG